MNQVEVVKLARDAMIMVMVLGGPALLTSVVVGTLVALIQAVTQVHEQTLTFLPKLICVGAVLAATAGWTLEMGVGYTTRSFDAIATLGE
jgi:flagellar biosynthetic protein FliQ